MSKSLKSGALTSALLIAGSLLASQAQAEIAVTIKPIELLVKQLAKNVDNVTLVIPATKSPHTYHLTPRDAQNIGNAKLLVYISEYVETDVGKLAESNRFKNVERIELLNLPSIQSKLLKNEEEDDHHDHDHGPGDHDHDHDHEGEFNSHIWLSPEIMSIAAKDIAQKLKQIYPNKKSQIEKNLNDFEKTIPSLEREVKQITQGLQNKGYFSYHDAYVYFEKAYDLKNVGILNPNVFNNITPTHLAELESKIKEENVHCIFVEPQFDASQATKYFKNHKLKFGILDPIGANLPENSTYADFILSTAKAYSSCLK